MLKKQLVPYKNKMRKLDVTQHEIIHRNVATEVKTLMYDNVVFRVTRSILLDSIKYDTNMNNY